MVGSGSGPVSTPSSDPFHRALRESVSRLRETGGRAEVIGFYRIEPDSALAADHRSIGVRLTTGSDSISSGVVHEVGANWEVVLLHSQQTMEGWGGQRLGWSAEKQTVLESTFVEPGRCFRVAVRLRAFGRDPTSAEWPGPRRFVLEFVGLPAGARVVPSDPCEVREGFQFDSFRRLYR